MCQHLDQLMKPAAQSRLQTAVNCGLSAMVCHSPACTSTCCAAPFLLQRVACKGSSALHWTLLLPAQTHWGLGAPEAVPKLGPVPSTAMHVSCYIPAANAKHLNNPQGKACRLVWSSWSTLALAIDRGTLRSCWQVGCCFVNSYSNMLGRVVVLAHIMPLVLWCHAGIAIPQASSWAGLVLLMLGMFISSGCYSVSSLSVKAGPLPCSHFRPWCCRHWLMAR